MHGIIRFLMVMLSVVVFSTSAMAIGVIDLDVTVNPNYGGNFSGLGDTTGTALYNFGIRPTSAHGATSVYLFFEGDIFSSISAPSVLSGPVGFSFFVDNNFPGDSSIDGGALLPGQYVRFTVDYTLTDTYAYYFGTDPNHIPAQWSWSLDGPEAWGQAVAAVNFNGTRLVATGGGSAAIPEPSALVLLGSALVGLGIFRRVHTKSDHSV